MIYRELGASGIEVSAVGFGAWAIGGWMWGGTDDEKSLAAIHAALDHGVNLIDTAPVYGFGHSEEIVGRAIAGRRDKVVLATKCGLIWDREEGTFFFHSDEHGVTRQPSAKKIYRCLRPDSIRAELDRSLGRLKTDYVDLYQTHWQDPTRRSKTPGRPAEAEGAREDPRDRRLQRHGRRNAGLWPDRRRPGEIQPLGPQDRGQRHGRLLPAARDRDFGLFAPGQRAVDRQDPARPRVRPRRPAEGKSPFHRRPRRAGQRHAGGVGALAAERHGATIGQLVIAWTFAQPGITCVLCGARDAAQADGKRPGRRLALPPEELRS